MKLFLSIFAVVLIIFGLLVLLGNRRKELYKLYWQNYRITSVYIEVYKELLTDCDEGKRLANQIWLNMFERFNNQTATFLVKLRQRKETRQDQLDMLVINKILREHHDTTLPLHWQDSFDEVAKPMLGWDSTVRDLMKNS